MKQTSFLTLGVPAGALLALLGSDLTQDPQAGAPQRAPAIGVVDFVQVFENYPSFTKSMQELEGLFKQHQGHLDQEKAKLDELEIRIRGLQPDTTKRDELELEYKLLQERIRGLGSLYETDIQRTRYQAIVDGYAEIEKAIREVAKDKGVDLVLRLHPDPKEDPLPIRKKAYDQRDVWHVDEKLDLTPAVISVLKFSPSGQGGEK